MAILSPSGDALWWCNQAFARLAEDQRHAATDAADQLRAEVIHALGGAPLALSARAEPIALPNDALPGLRGVLQIALGPQQGALILCLRRRDRGEAAQAGQITTDVVTGLPDRRSLESKLQSRFFCPGPPFALLFVDLNGFKQVNDSLGHLAGDRTLREVASRLRSTLRDEDEVARFGGDEFVILIAGVADRASLEPIVARLETAVVQQLPGIASMAVSASIGVALSTSEYDSLEAMIEAADRDMYARKRRRK